jgi:oligopeptide/dipeptide ABC transporter ATP-binding protein
VESEPAHSVPPDSSADGTAPLLEVHDLHVSFKMEYNTIYAVQGLDIDLRAGERLGMVGESGSGKSISALSIMQMVPSPGRITKGEIFFAGQELVGLSRKKMRQFRGGQIGMIPQNPLTSLNPVLTVEDHFQEVLSLHIGLNKAQGRERTIELLRSVGIPDPATRMGEYPHRLSGGQRQRVMIAMAMACQPRILIADEPTTALDVTIQAQILELFDDLVTRSNLGAILITHNLGIVAGHCDRVVVMYAGRIMETANVYDLFDRPAHPYTHGLLRCVPRITTTRSRTFHSIPGLPPRVTELTAGCPFAPRCERASDQCRTETPPTREVAPGHAIACWHPYVGEAEVA